MIRLGRPVASAAEMSTGARALTMSATPSTLASTTPLMLSGSASHSGPSVDPMRPALLMSTCRRRPVSASRAPTASRKDFTESMSSVRSPTPVAAAPVASTISAAAPSARSVAVAVTTTWYPAEANASDRYRPLPRAPPVIPAIVSAGTAVASGAASPVGRVVAQGSFSPIIYSSASDFGSVTLGSQLRRRLPHCRGLIGLERAVRGAEGQTERQRLLALGQLVAGVEVEGLEQFELFPRTLAQRRGQGLRGQFGIDDERDVLARDRVGRQRTAPGPQGLLRQQRVEVDLEGDRARRQGEVLAHLRVQLTGMAEDLPIGEDELRGPTRMPGSDLVGFDGDLESVRLRDPADRVDDIGGLGPATL